MACILWFVSNVVIILVSSKIFLYKPNIVREALHCSVGKSSCDENRPSCGDASEYGITAGMPVDRQREKDIQTTVQHKMNCVMIMRWWHTFAEIWMLLSSSTSMSVSFCISAFILSAQIVVVRATSLTILSFLPPSVPLVVDIYFRNWICLNSLCCWAIFYYCIAVWYTQLNDDSRVCFFIIPFSNCNFCLIMMVSADAVDVYRSKRLLDAVQFWYFQKRFVSTLCDCR